jgi:hypothetical protein
MERGQQKVNAVEQVGLLRMSMPGLKNVSGYRTCLVSAVSSLQILPVQFSCPHDEASRFQRLELAVRLNFGY